MILTVVSSLVTPSMPFANERAAALTNASTTYGTIPNISITSPKAGTQLSSGKLVVTGTAQALVSSGVSRVEVKLNNSAYYTATPKATGDWSSWTVTIDMTAKATGSYKVIARATDGAGNKNWTQVMITYSLYDDFSSTYTLTPSYNSPNGKWQGVWNGAGSFGVKSVNGNGEFYEQSSSVTSSSATQSSLALSTQKFKNFKLSLDVTTNAQTRLNNPPNHWEVAWVIWHWNDNTHFNYFVVKTNGPESGKYDGGVNPTSQQILKTAQSPTAVIGKTMHWDITVQGSHITIAVDGATVFDFYDSSSFNTGTIGLYSEDSSVTFDNVNVLPL